MDQKTCELKPNSLKDISWSKFMDIYFNDMMVCMRDYIDYQNAIVSDAYLEKMNQFKGYAGEDFCGTIDKIIEQKLKEKKTNNLNFICPTIRALYLKNNYKEYSTLSPLLISGKKRCSNCGRQDHVSNETDCYFFGHPKGKEGQDYVWNDQPSIILTEQEHIAWKKARNEKFYKNPKNRYPFTDILCKAAGQQPRPVTKETERSLLEKFKKMEGKLKINIWEFLKTTQLGVLHQFIDIYKVTENNTSIDLALTLWFYVVPIFYFDIKKIGEGIFENTLFKDFMKTVNSAEDSLYQVLNKQFNIKQTEVSQPFEALKFIIRYIFINMIINITKSEKSPAEKEQEINKLKTKLKKMNDMKLTDLYEIVSKIDQDKDPELIVQPLSEILPQTDDCNDLPTPPPVIVAQILEENRNIDPRITPELTPDVLLAIQQVVPLPILQNGGTVEPPPTFDALGESRYKGVMEGGQVNNVYSFFNRFFDRLQEPDAINQDEFREFAEIMDNVPEQIDDITNPTTNNVVTHITSLISKLTDFLTRFNGFIRLKISEIPTKAYNLITPIIHGIQNLITTLHAYKSNIEHSISDNETIQKINSLYNSILKWLAQFALYFLLTAYNNITTLYRIYTYVKVFKNEGFIGIIKREALGKISTNFLFWFWNHLYSSGLRILNITLESYFTTFLNDTLNTDQVEKNLLIQKNYREFAIIYFYRKIAEIRNGFENGEEPGFNLDILRDFLSKLPNKIKCWILQQINNDENKKRFKEFYDKHYNKLRNEINKYLSDYLIDIKGQSLEFLNNMFDKIPNINIIGIYGSQIIYSLFPKIFLQMPKNNLALSFLQVLSQNCNKSLKSKLDDLSNPSDPSEFIKIQQDINMCLKSSVQKILENTFKLILSNPTELINMLDLSEPNKISKDYSNKIVKFFFNEQNNTLETTESSVQSDNWDIKNILYKIRDFLINFVPKEFIFQFNEIVDIIAIILEQLTTSIGKELFIFQLASGFYTSICNPKTDLYKNIQKRNIIDIFRSLIRTFIVNLPTTCHKIFQMVDLKIKATKYASYYVYWFGEKLKYPEMGKIETEIIADKIIKKTKDKIAMIEVGDFITAASVGQVYKCKSTNSDREISEILAKFDKYAVDDTNYDFLNNRFRSYSYNILKIKTEKEMTELFTKNIPSLSKTLDSLLACIDLKKIEGLFSPENFKRSIDIYSVPANRIRENHLIKSNENLFFVLAFLTNINSSESNELIKYFSKDNLEKLQKIWSELRVSSQYGPEESINKMKEIVENCNNLIVKFVGLPDDQRLDHNQGRIIVYLKQIIKIFNILFKTLNSKNKEECKDNLDKPSDIATCQTLLLLDKPTKECIMSNHYDSIAFIESLKYFIKKIQKLRKEYDDLKGIIEKLNGERTKVKLNYGSEIEINIEIPKIYKYLLEIVDNPHTINDKVIKFIKIRSRMMMCLEKQIFPDSIARILIEKFIKPLVEDKEKESIMSMDIRELHEKYKFKIPQNKRKQYNFIISIYKWTDCKILDVLDEFDLWDEIVNTLQGYYLYTFNKNFEGIEDYRIITADVSDTMSCIEGFKSTEDREFVDTKGEEYDSTGLTDSELDDLVSKKQIYEKKLYVAVLQTLLPGKDIADIVETIHNSRKYHNKEEGADSSNIYSKKEYECLQKSVNKFAALFLSNVITKGKYHGDPHTGNIKWSYNSIYEKGTLSIIDFGDFPQISERNRLLVVGLVFSGLLTQFLTETNKDLLLNYISEMLLMSFDIQDYSFNDLCDQYKEHIDTSFDKEKYINISHQSRINMTYCMIESLTNYFSINIKNKIKLKYSNLKAPKSAGHSLQVFLGDEDFIESILGNISKTTQQKCNNIFNDISKMCQSVLKLFDTINLVGINPVQFIIDFVYSFNTLTDKKTQEMLNIVKMLHGTFMTLGAVSNSNTPILLTLREIITPMYFVGKQLAFVNYELSNMFAGGINFLQNTLMPVKQGETRVGLSWWVDNIFGNWKWVVLGVAATAALGMAAYSAATRGSREEERAKEAIESMLEFNLNKTKLDRFITSTVNCIIFILVHKFNESQWAEIKEHIMDCIRNNSEENSTKINLEEYAVSFPGFDPRLYNGDVQTYINTFNDFFSFGSTIIKNSVSAGLWTTNKLANAANWLHHHIYMDPANIPSLTNFKSESKSYTHPMNTNITKYKNKIKDLEEKEDGKINVNNYNILYIVAIVSRLLKVKESIDILKKNLHIVFGDITTIDDYEINSLNQELFTLYNDPKSFNKIGMNDKDDLIHIVFNQVEINDYALKQMEDIVGDTLHECQWDEAADLREHSLFSTNVDTNIDKYLNTRTKETVIFEPRIRKIHLRPFINKFKAKLLLSKIMTINNQIESIKQKDYEEFIKKIVEHYQGNPRSAEKQKLLNRAKSDYMNDTISEYIELTETSWWFVTKKTRIYKNERVRDLRQQIADLEKKLWAHYAGQSLTVKQSSGSYEKGWKFVSGALINDFTKVVVINQAGDTTKDVLVEDILRWNNDLVPYVKTVRGDKQMNIFQAIFCRIIYYKFINNSLYNNYDIIKAFFKQKQEAQEKYLVSIVFTYNLMKIKNKFSYEFLYNQIKHLCSISTDVTVCYDVFDTPANNSSSFFRLNDNQISASFFNYFDLESKFWQLDYMLMLKKPGDDLYDENVNKNKINAICENMESLISEVIKKNDLFTDVCKLVKYLNYSRTYSIDRKNFKNMNLFNVDKINDLSEPEISNMLHHEEQLFLPHTSKIEVRQDGFLLGRIEPSFEKIFFYGVDRYYADEDDKIHWEKNDGEDDAWIHFRGGARVRYKLDKEELHVLGITINDVNTKQYGFKWQVFTPWMYYWDSVWYCMFLMGFDPNDIKKVFGLPTITKDTECPNFDYFSKNYKITNKEAQIGDILKEKNKLNKEAYTREMSRQVQIYNDYLKYEFQNILSKSLDKPNKLLIKARNEALAIYEESVKKTNNLLEDYKKNLLTLEYYTYN
jgi:hypothetical protein